MAGSGNKKGRDLWILKYLISTSSSSFSIRLIFDPQFFCFFLWENCDHEITSLAAHLSLWSFMHDLDKFVSGKNIWSIRAFVDFTHRNDVSENPQHRPVADMMQYDNNFEERLKDSSAANERGDEHDYPWPRNPDLKELKKIDDKSHLSTAHHYGHHSLCTTIIILNKI